MVAICSTSALRNCGGIASTSTETLRQSSLRSVTSTHSRDSLAKHDFHDISDTCYNKHRVHFASVTDCKENSEPHELESVLEFDSADPLEPLYLTSSEIMKIRVNAKVEASHFAQVYPNYIAEINHLFQNGGGSLNLANQVKRLRTRRRRLDPFDIALQSPDRDVDQCNEYTEELNVANNLSDLPDGNDNSFDDMSYFCTMRGLESRISPLFRLNRRLTIRKVINLQAELKNSGCCPVQIQMGLRAVSAHASQRPISFAIYQAALDECEVNTQE